MSTFRKLLLKLLKPLVHRLERTVHRLQMADWKPELDGRTREVLNGGCYSIEEKEAAMTSVLFGERIDPPINGATVRVVDDENEYRLKATLFRPHGLDYEPTGQIEVLSVKRPEPLKAGRSVVIISVSALAASITRWKNQPKEAIQLRTQKKWAR